jgi:cytoskeletal protein RodZ
MQDLREAKDRRAKKLAIGLSVVLVLVLAFEVPKMLKHGGSSAAAPASTTTPVSTTPSSTPTTAPGTAAAAVTPVASTKLPNSDTQPRVGKSQLYSFSHFSGKDPFVQQVVAQAQVSGTANSGGSSTSAGSTNAGAGTTASVTHRNQSRTLAVTGAARIAVNGRVQVVRVGANFPSANPLFRLVSVSGGTARIGIAGGSYSSGAKTVSLVAGRTLTLVDTADGVRYQLRLLTA